MRMMKNVSSARFVRGAMAAAAVAVLAACGSDNNGPKNADVHGTYALSTVNGSTLPYTVTGTGENVEVVQAATISLTSDSTYAVNVTGTSNGSASNIVTDAGTYKVTGTQVTFTSTTISGANYTASYTNNKLTASIAGVFVHSSDVAFTLVFDKAT